MSIAAAERTAQDFTQAVNEAMVQVGEKFGLYNALAKVGPATVSMIAEFTGISRERIGHWLTEQAAADYLYVDGNGHFSVSCPWPGAAN